MIDRFRTFFYVFVILSVVMIVTGVVIWGLQWVWTVAIPLSEPWKTVAIIGCMIFLVALLAAMERRNKHGAR